MKHTQHLINISSDIFAKTNKWFVFVCLLYLSYRYIYYSYCEFPDLPSALDGTRFFYDSLHAGVFPLWNPYMLWGKIATLYNSVNVSIFLPYFYIFGVTATTIFYASMAEIVLSFLSLYFIGHILGYNRYYSLIVVILLSPSYWLMINLTNLAFVSNLFFYPITFVLLLKILISKKDFSLNLKDWLVFTILLSLSYIGARMEIFLYQSAIILFLLLIFSLFNWAHHRIVILYLLGGLAALTLAFLTNAWQLSMILNAVSENARLAGTNFKAVTSSLFWEWISISLLYQPELILIAVNFLLFVIAKKWLPHSCSTGEGKIWKRYLRIAFICTFVFVLELMLYKIIIEHQPYDQLITYFQRTTRSSTLALGKGIGLKYIGLISFAVTFYLYLLGCVGKIKLSDIFVFLGALFSIYYIADQLFYFDSNLLVLLSLGIIGTIKKRRLYIIALLVLFICCGKTGVFILSDVFGIPWLPCRAQLFAIPLLIVLLLEAIDFIVSNAIQLIRFFFKNKYDFLISHFSIKFITPLFFLVLLILFIQYSLPYSPTNMVTMLKKPSEKAIAPKQLNSYTRKISVPLPKSSGMINAAPLSESDIPRSFQQILSLDRSPFVIHVEMDALYKTYLGLKKGLIKSNPNISISEFRNYLETEYAKQIYIDFSNPAYSSNMPLYKELLAREDAETPRSFITSRVIKFDTFTDEILFLKKHLSSGGLLKDQITTSDKRFNDIFIPEQSAKNIEYSLKFIQDKPEHIILDILTNQSAYLALLDSFSKGWQAYVDNINVPIYRAYMGTRFIPIPSGQHTVEFRYNIPYLYFSIIISFFAWAFLLGLSLSFSKRWRQLIKSKLF